MFDSVVNIVLGVEQHDPQSDNQQMVDKTVDVTKQVEEIKAACAISDDVSFAKILGLKSPQVLTNWKRRNTWTRDALRIVPERTGASADWMLGRSHVTFPDGPKVKVPVTPEKRFLRIEEDIDQIRNAFLGLVLALEKREPGTAVAFQKVLAATARSEEYAERGFHGLLEVGLQHVAELVEEERQSAPAHGAQRPVRRKHAL